MDKFSLRHVVLYAKGWYKAENGTKTIWDDLEIMLEADGYQGCFIGDSLIQRKSRIAYLIVGQFDRLPKNGHSTSLQAFFNGIQDNVVWKYGYYTKTNFHWGKKEDIAKLPDYDYYTAVVKYCLSYFGQLETKEWQPIKPDYKLLPRKNGITDKVIKKQFANVE